MEIVVGNKIIPLKEYGVFNGISVFVSTERFKGHCVSTGIKTNEQKTNSSSLSKMEVFNHEDLC